MWPRASPESLSMHSRTIPEPLSRDNLLSPHFTCSFLPSLFPLLPACSLFHAPSLVSLFLFCFTCSFFLPPKGTSLLFPSLYWGWIFIDVYCFWMIPHFWNFWVFLTLMEMTSLMTGFILNGLSESLLSSRLFRIKAWVLQVPFLSMIFFTFFWLL